MFSLCAEGFWRKRNDKPRTTAESHGPESYGQRIEGEKQWELSLIPEFRECQKGVMGSTDNDLQRTLSNSIRGHPPPKLGRGDMECSCVLCSHTHPFPRSTLGNLKTFSLKGKILKIKLLTSEKARAAHKEPWSVLI